jgi:hypothetical protein
LKKYSFKQFHLIFCTFSANSYALSSEMRITILILDSSRLLWLFDSIINHSLIPTSHTTCDLLSTSVVSSWTAHKQLIIAYKIVFEMFVTVVTDKNGAWIVQDEQQTVETDQKVAFGEKLTILQTAIE